MLPAMSTATLKNKLVLVRHGESTWNLENRFTGWVDVGLSPKGALEAHAAGRLLKAEGFAFDRCYSSLLKRARPWSTSRLVMQSSWVIGFIGRPPASICMVVL